MWVEITIFSIIAAFVLFKINHPQFRWGCFIGKHEYHYSHERHGMHIDKNSPNVIGTKRRIFICSCGYQKAAEKQDYI